MFSLKIAHSENLLAQLNKDELIKTALDYQERLDRTLSNIINDLT